MSTRSVALALIADVANTAQNLVLDPDVKDAAAETKALEGLLDSARQAVIATATSSNAIYALRDMPHEAQASLRMAVHALSVLKSLHYPKAGNPDE